MQTKLLQLPRTARCKSISFVAICHEVIKELGTKAHAIPYFFFSCLERLLAHKTPLTIRVYHVFTVSLSTWLSFSICFPFICVRGLCTATWQYCSVEVIRKIVQQNYSHLVMIISYPISWIHRVTIQQSRVFFFQLGGIFILCTHRKYWCGPHWSIRKFYRMKFKC